MQHEQPIPIEGAYPFGQIAHMPAILRGLINLGRTLDLEIVAEGIEEELQRTHLRDGGAGLAQGYLFAAPLERADAGLLLLGQTESAGEDAAAPA